MDETIIAVAIIAGLFAFGGCLLAVQVYRLNERLDKIEQRFPPDSRVKKQDLRLGCVERSVHDLYARLGALEARGWLDALKAWLK